MSFKLSEQVYGSIDYKSEQSLKKPKSAIRDEARQKELLILIREMEKSVDIITDQTQKALMYYEIGLIWKDKIADIRNAMVNFQKSYEADDTFLPNLKVVREIFLQKGNWDFVINIIETELEHIKNDYEKIHLTALLAEIYKDKKDDIKTAEEIIENLFKEHYTQFFILRKLKAFLYSQKKYQKYFKIGEDILKKEDLSDQYKVSLLIDLIVLIYQKRVPYKLKLETLLKELMKIPIQNSFYFEKIDWEKIAYEIDKKIVNSGGDVNSEDVYILFRIYNDYIEDKNRANRVLMSNSRYVEDNYLLLIEFEKHYQENNNWEKLIKTKQKKVKLLESKREKSDICYEIGVIYLEKLHNQQSSKSYFLKALEYTSDNLAAIKKLGKIYYMSNDIKNLIKYHLLEANKSDNNTIKTIQYFKVAQIYQHHLKNDQDAETFYLRSLDFDSHYLPSIQNLLKLYDNSGNWEGYIKISTLYLEKISDDQIKFQIKYKIAQIYLEKLKAENEAYKYFLQLFEEDPDNQQIFEYLEDILEKKKDKNGLIELYEKSLEHLNEPSQRINILTKISNIFTDFLNKPTEAIPYLKKILDTSPNYLPAIQKLASVYHKENMWEELVELNLNEVDVTESTIKKTQLLIEIAKIYQNQVEDSKKALEYYEMGLQYDPENVEIISQLETLYIELALTEQLIDLFESRVDSINNKKLKSSYMVKVGELYLSHFNKEDKAIECFEIALEYLVDNKIAFSFLKELYLKNGQIDKLISLMNRFETHIVQGEKGEIYYQFAQLYYIYKNSIEKAEEYIFRALYIKKSRKYYEFLIRLYFDQNRFEKVLTIKDEYYTLLKDEEKIDFAQYIISYAENNPKFEYIPLKEYELFFNHYPNNYIFFKLFSLLYKNGLWKDLVNLIEKRLENNEDKNEKVDLNYQLGQIFEYYAKNFEKALSYYNESLSIDPNHYISLQAQKRIYKKTGNLQKMIATVQKEADIQSLPDDMKLELNYKNGVILVEQFKKIGEAIKLFEINIEISPLHDKSFQKLYSLYLSQNRFEDALKLLNKRIKVTKDLNQKGKLLAKKSELISKHFNDPEKSENILEEIIETDPTNIDIYLKLLASLLQKKDYKKLLFWAEKAEQQNPTTKQYQHILLVSFKAHLALKDSKNIARIGEMLIPQNILPYEDQKTIFEHYKILNKWDLFLDGVERLIPKAPKHEKVDLMVQYLEIFKKKTNESTWVDKLHSWFEKTRSYKLLELYIENGESKQEYLDTIKYIESHLVYFSGADVLGPLNKKLGELYLKLENTPKAITFFQKALDYSPNDQSIFAPLRELYLSSKSYYPNILSIYPDMIKKDIKNISLIEDIFKVRKFQDETELAYRLASIIQLLKIKNSDSSRIYRTNYSTDITQYNFYEGAQLLYLFSENDKSSLRQLLYTALDGIGRSFKRTVSDYSSLGLEKVTSKNHPSLWDMFSKYKDEFYINPLDIYVKKDDTYMIDYIFPDNFALVVPENMLKIGKKELSFFLGQAFDRIKSLEFLTQYYTKGEIVFMIKAILNYTLEEDLFDEANVQMAQKQFSRGVPRATKKALQNLKPTIEMTSWGDLDFESYLNGAHTTAIRVGLLISGDINYAAKAILKQYNPTENFFALSDIVAAAESFRDFKELLLYSFDEKYIRLAGLLGQRVISKSR